MKIPLFQIDAFTNKVFRGNPAAVCPLESWLDDAALQNIALENNLSETAFFVKENDGYKIRWFTPTSEIDLCGHATLASAFVLFSELKYQGDLIRFFSQSGELRVSKKDHLLVLDFPTRRPVPTSIPESLIAALGVTSNEVLKSRDYFCVLNSEEQVASLSPNQDLLKTLDADVLVTARGKNADFVSRYFAPLAGIPEDPVTGSTHCNLIPYWSEKLEKTKLVAHQISKRGGVLYCEMLGDRVNIAGECVKFLQGTIFI